jgi:hypothetical protein
MRQRTKRDSNALSRFAAPAGWANPTLDIFERVVPPLLPTRNAADTPLESPLRAAKPYESALRKA